MRLSTRMGLLVFAVLVAVVFFFLLDLVGVHLPYVSRYLAVIVAILLYTLAAKIADKLKDNKL